jgi:hypothetical protein
LPRRSRLAKADDVPAGGLRLFCRQAFKTHAIFGPAVAETASLAEKPFYRSRGFSVDKNGASESALD